MAEDAERIGESILNYLGMAFRPVGVKLFQTEINHPARPEKPTYYCRSVRDAAQGRDLLIRPEDEACDEACVALGFREPKLVNFEPRIKIRTKAIRLGPLRDADHVIFILTAEQAMTIAILVEGIKAWFKGELSVCGEITAQIANQGQPNLSLLCNGARRYGEYRADEVVVGLPYDVFLKLPEKMSKHDSLGHKAKAGIKHLFVKIR